MGYVLGAPPVVMMDIAEVTVTHGQKRWMDGWMDGWMAGDVFQRGI